jgi:hypothetical protein
MAKRSTDGRYGSIALRKNSDLLGADLPDQAEPHPVALRGDHAVALVLARAGLVADESSATTGVVVETEVARRAKAGVVDAAVGVAAAGAVKVMVARPRAGATSTSGAEARRGPALRLARWSLDPVSIQSRSWPERR